MILDTILVKIKLSRPLREACKEFGRVVVLAVIPVLIAGLEGTGVNFKQVAIVGAVAFLKSVDRYIHKIGKERESEVLTKGLVRF